MTSNYAHKSVVIYARTFAFHQMVLSLYEETIFQIRMASKVFYDIYRERWTSHDEESDDILNGGIVTDFYTLSETAESLNKLER